MNRDLEEYIDLHYSDVKDNLTDEIIKRIENSQRYAAFVLGKRCREFGVVMKESVVKDLRRLGIDAIATKVIDSFKNEIKLNTKGSKLFPFDDANVEAEKRLDSIIEEQRKKQEGE